MYSSGAQRKGGDCKSYAFGSRQHERVPEALSRASIIWGGEDQVKRRKPRKNLQGTLIIARGRGEKGDCCGSGAKGVFQARLFSIQPVRTAW